jgi:aminoglycoside phosphotransferase (APT) family kinase protein
MHSFDPAELSTYLSAHVPGFDGLEAITRFSDGQSNPTYKLTTKSGSFVLRAKPPGVLLPSAHQIEREYHVMQALAQTAVPVPKMLHLCREDAPFGAAFFVMEMLEGRVLWDPLLPGMTPPERTAIHDAMITTLARLHSVNPTQIGLADFGAPGNYFARQCARWTKQYRATQTQARPDVDWLIDWLAQNLPADDGQIAITHGDFRLDNMVFAPNAPEVLGLLDWELSTLGHPMADLAYQCMGLRLPNSGLVRGLGGADRAALGIPFEDTYIARYCTLRGIDLPRNWPFYLTFSYFRLLAILQGIVARAQSGNASNPGDMVALAASITTMATDACAIARGD